MVFRNREMGSAISTFKLLRSQIFMFSFFIRNWKKIEAAIKIIAFVVTVILEAIKTVGMYAEQEIKTAQ